MLPQQCHVRAHGELEKTLGLEHAISRGRSLPDVASVVPGSTERSSEHTGLHAHRISVCSAQSVKQHCRDDMATGLDMSIPKLNLVQVL